MSPLTRGSRLMVKGLLVTNVDYNNKEVDNYTFQNIYTTPCECIDNHLHYPYDSINFKFLKKIKNK